MGRFTSGRSMRAFLLVAFAVTALLGGAAVFLALGAQLAIGAVAPPTQGQMLGNQRANLTTAISSKNVGHMHRIWFKRTKDAVTGTPQVWGGSVVFADWSGMVWRVRASNGSVLSRSYERPHWRYAEPNRKPQRGMPSKACAPDRPGRP